MKRHELIEKLQALGFEYSSTNNYGIDCYEVWYKHPSGAHINLDNNLDHDPAYLQRKLDIIPHKIRIHDYEQLVSAEAKAYAEAKGRYAERHYYLCDCGGEQDWSFRINTRMFGTTLEYMRGKDFLPEEYEKVADSFRKLQPK